MIDETNNTDPTAQDNTNANPAEEAATETQDTKDAELMDEGGNETPPDAGDDLMGESTDEETTEEESAEQPKGAPEKYEAFKLTDGYTMSDEQFNEYSEVAKELGLSQEFAQRLIDFDIKRQNGFAEAQKAADNKAIEGWIAEARKEHGEKYPEVLARAKKVYTSDLMSKEFRTLLKATSMNKNPHFLNFLNNIGSKMSEDVFVNSETKVKGKNEGGINSMFSDLNKT
jgi:hypothetical protein